MGYIGRGPVKSGAFRIIDDVSSSFNGSTTAFTLQSSSSNITPGTEQNLLIAVDGVVQEPQSAFTISGSTLTFTSAPASGASFWGIELGDVGGIAANVANGAVDTAQLAADAVDGTKLADDAIDSEHYTDASIDLAHMSVNSVDSDQYVDSSIDTAHIAASQITNALMADDAIGVAELSATGTASSSTFLRGDNAWATAGATDIGALVYKSAYQSISNDSLTTITFDLETYDTDTIHDNSTNNSRLTCKTAGKYIIFGRIIYAANATGVRGLKLLHNGNAMFDYINSPGSGNLSGGVSVTEVKLLAVDDYVELQAYQTSGGNLNVKYTTFTVFGMQQLIDTT